MQYKYNFPQYMKHNAASLTPWESHFTLENIAVWCSKGEKAYYIAKHESSATALCPSTI